MTAASCNDNDDARASACSRGLVTHERRRALSGQVLRAGSIHIRALILDKAGHALAAAAGLHVDDVVSKGGHGKGEAMVTKPP